MRLVTGQLPREMLHVRTAIAGGTRRAAAVSRTRLAGSTGFARQDARPPRAADIEDVESVGVELHERRSTAVEDWVEVLPVAGPLPRAPENRPWEIGARRDAVLVVHKMNRAGEYVMTIGVLAAVGQQAVRKFKVDFLRRRVAVEIDEHLAGREHKIGIRLRVPPRVVGRHLLAV